MKVSAATTRIGSFTNRQIGRMSALRERLKVGAGWRGKVAVTTAILRGRWRRKPGASPRPVPIPMKDLGGEVIHVRPQTSDLTNAAAYFAHGIHRPPPEISNLRRIVELGSNMGAGLTALALEHPEASLLGVEADVGNLAIAHLNTARFGDRVRVVEGAIWDESVNLVIDPEIEAGEHGYAVREARSTDPMELTRLRALTIDELLDEAFPGEEIDYMHVTIEGTERRVFAAGGEWPQRVRSLRVEVHPYFGYLTEECIGQLEDLGFRAFPVPSPADKWVYAVAGSGKRS